MQITNMRLARLLRRNAVRIGIALALTLTLNGCRSLNEEKHLNESNDYRPFVERIEYPNACPGPSEPESQAAPPSVANHEQLTPWPMTLQEAIQTALRNSQVMRDIGGRVITAPTGTATVFDPAIQESNPQAGVEAALSAFDAQLAAGLTFARSENKFNNFFFGGGSSSVAANTGDFNLGISKTAATGTTFTARNATNYLRNNIPINRFHSTYTTLFQAEVRHPLLQGSGVEFNRIAGPSGINGVYNGVLVARINNDITLAQFEAAVRDLCRDVEQTYWELYYSYQNLETRLRGRRAAAEIWEKENARLNAEVGRRDEEALARQQFYDFQTQVENALTGYNLNLGVFGAERQLRRLMGIAPADGRLIRPADAPSVAEVVFDWSASVTESIQRRVELRQQRWLVRRRELEATAARNFTLPRLDLISQYGWRGFGDDLFGNSGVPEGSAFADLFGGDLQDWRLGLEYTSPVGNRAGYAALHSARLQLNRERAILRTQEQHVEHELAAAFSSLDRAYANVRSRYNGRIAALDRVSTISKRAGETERVFFLLDAQQQAANAQSAYHRAVVDYNLAVMNVEYHRGTLLNYANVALTEGPWSSEAHASAAKQSRNFAPREHALRQPDNTPVSCGPYDQSRPIDGAPFPADISPLPEQPLTPPANRRGPSPEAVNGVEALPQP